MSSPLPGTANVPPARSSDHVHSAQGTALRRVLELPSLVFLFMVQNSRLSADIASMTRVDIDLVVPKMGAA